MFKYSNSTGLTHRSSGLVFECREPLLTLTAFLILFIFYFISYTCLARILRVIIRSLLTFLLPFFNCRCRC